MSRSGSEQRKATKFVSARCTPEQHAAIEAAARSSGLSVNALFLKTLLGLPSPRIRRPKTNDKLLAKFLADLGRVRGDIGKSGSLLNQAVHYLHAGRSIENVANMIEIALEQHNEAVRDLLELRQGGMQALGMETGQPGKDEDP